MIVSYYHLQLHNWTQASQDSFESCLFWEDLQEIQYNGTTDSKIIFMSILVFSVCKKKKYSCRHDIVEKLWILVLPNWTDEFENIKAQYDRHRIFQGKKFILGSGACPVTGELMLQVLAPRWLPGDRLHRGKIISYHD